MTLTAKPPTATRRPTSRPTAASARPTRDGLRARGCAAAGSRRSSSLAPMLLVFTVFSWSPIVQSVDHELPEDQPHRPAELGRPRQLRATCSNDPLLGTAILNTLYFALLALLFGFPLPIFLAVLMSEVRRGKGFYSALAYLPVVIPPVVAVLLWKFFYDASPTGVFNTILGWVGIPPQPWLQSRRPRCPRSCSRRPGRPPAAAIIIYLAALLERAARAVRRGRGRRRVASGARSGTSPCRSCAASSSSC